MSFSVFDTNDGIQFGVSPSNEPWKPSRNSFFMFHGEKLTWSAIRLLSMHPFKKGFIGYAFRHKGRQESWHRCKSCNTTYAVLPSMKQGDESDLWDYCCADTCSSYDPHNDASWLLGGN